MKYNQSAALGPGFLRGQAVFTHYCLGWQESFHFWSSLIIGLDLHPVNLHPVPGKVMEQITLSATKPRRPMAPGLC